MTAIAERHAAWERRIPEDEAQLWAFVARLDQAEQLKLLAHCASLSVNAMQLPKRTETAGFGACRSAGRNPPA